MPASKPAFSAGAASTTWWSYIPPGRVTHAYVSKNTSALRQSIRGMEAQLVDLVFQNLSQELMLDWLRVPFGCAAITDNLAAVKRLLAAGVDIEVPPERSQPAPLLHLAAESGGESVVEELLLAGVDVNETDMARDDRSALHCAAAAGNDAAVRALTSAGADIDLLDGKGWAPLHHACRNGHRGVVVFLLLTGACALNDLEELPVLHLAAKNNLPAVIEDLLSFGNVSIGRLDAQGQSALHLAAKHGAVEACVALLRGGASVGRTDSTGLTCLDVAASSGHTGRLLWVLTSDEEADNRKRRCSIALGYAVTADKPDTVRDLVALGADVEYREAGTIPYLHSASARDQYKVAKALLEAGANVEARFGGSTPLHYACRISHSRAVGLLLLWGANEKARCWEDGATASELVGSARTPPDQELLPDKFAEYYLIKAVIRSMLETAPGDRSWRRRGWLALCRERWLARVGEREKRSSALLDVIPDHATRTKKRRGKMLGSALGAKARSFPLDKGSAHRRNEGGGRRLPEATAPSAAAVLRLGPCSVLSDVGAGQAAGVKKPDDKTRFVAAVEQLLLLREDSIFREVVTFL